MFVAYRRKYKNNIELTFWYCVGNKKSKFGHFLLTLKNENTIICYNLSHFKLFKDKDTMNIHILLKGMLEVVKTTGD